MRWSSAHSRCRRRRSPRRRGSRSFRATGSATTAVDVAALNNRRIPLCIVGDVNSLSVAEHAMMLILACAKRLIRADRSVRAGPWGWRNRLEAGEISGKHLLIIGYGRRGRHLARMAEGFRMQMRAFDPFLVKQGWPDGPVAPVATLADGLAWADVISVHVAESRPSRFWRGGVRVDEAGRHRRQHRARRDRRRGALGAALPMDGSPLRVSTCSTTSRRRRIIRSSPSTRSCSRRISRA